MLPQCPPKGAVTCPAYFISQSVGPTKCTSVQRKGIYPWLLHLKQMLDRFKSAGSKPKHYLRMVNSFPAVESMNCLKLIIVFFSNVFGKLLLLLLTLTALFCALQFFLMSIWRKSQGLHCLIMRIQTERNSRMECLLGFLKPLPKIEIHETCTYKQHSANQEIETQFSPPMPSFCMQESKKGITTRFSE